MHNDNMLIDNLCINNNVSGNGRSFNNHNKDDYNDSDDNNNGKEQPQEQEGNREADDVQLGENNEEENESDEFKKITIDIQAIREDMKDIKSELEFLRSDYQKVVGVINLLNSMNGEIQGVKRLVEQLLSSPNHCIPSMPPGNFNHPNLIPSPASSSSIFSFFSKGNKNNNQQSYNNNYNNYNAHGMVSHQRRTVNMGYFVYNGEPGLQRAVEETFGRVKGLNGEVNFEFLPVTPPSPSKFLYFRRIADKRSKVFFDDLFNDTSFLSSIHDSTAIVFMVHTTKDSKEEFNVSKYTNNPCFVLKYFEQNANSLLNIIDNSTQLQAIAQYISR